ncbi:hypothetical protein P4H65_24075 [Paenibacillus chitinolyticus]|uniref:hypothetical protein n=1 Tax=Paenibacillus chitinolyticus TaxID=79263 RepID=UPI002DB92645|nr:hypothetical protein [Paenibacillus chitinolyticus]MEC0248875.1 hypothetical protein [Paenibacillus chitinolyticus]
MSQQIIKDIRHSRGYVINMAWMLPEDKNLNLIDLSRNLRHIHPEDRQFFLLIVLELISCYSERRKNNDEFEAIKPLVRNPQAFD